MKSEFLMAVADGHESIQAFWLTEPKAGSESIAIETETPDSTATSPRS